MNTEQNNTTNTFRIVMEWENGERHTFSSLYHEEKANSLISHFNKQLFNECEWQPILVRVWKEEGY